MASSRHINVPLTAMQVSVVLESICKDIETLSPSARAYPEARALEAAKAMLSGIQKEAHLDPFFCLPLS